MDISVNYTDADSLIERYAELMRLNVLKNNGRAGSQLITEQGAQQVLFF